MHPKTSRTKVSPTGADEIVRKVDGSHWNWVFLVQIPLGLFLEASGSMASDGENLHVPLVEDSVSGVNVWRSTECRM